MRLRESHTVQCLQPAHSLGLPASLSITLVDLSIHLIITLAAQATKGAEAYKLAPNQYILQGRPQPFVF